MNKDGVRLALGLMSGTSMDGIDLALLRSDGQSQVERLGGTAAPYSANVQTSLAAALDQAAQLGRPGPELDKLGAQITRLHADVVMQFLESWSGPQPDIIGFHGQTVLHRPEKKITWQIGDGGLLKELTGIPVVWDFRSQDVAAGGQGAPLASVYHAALAHGLDLPMAFLNLGGVSNLTWIDEGGAMLAFDCGPANALMDDWMAMTSGARFDADGQVAARGSIRPEILTGMADNPFFDLAPPKSLDRRDFDLGAVRGLPSADAMATLCAFTAECVWMAQTHLPAPVNAWAVTGGGRHNATLMGMLASKLAAPVKPVEAYGLDGDLLEAEAFAYLAIRSCKGLPLSFPGTTGVAEPMMGGVLSA